MKNSPIPETLHPLSKIAISFGVVLVSLLVFSIIGLVLSMLIFDINISTILNVSSGVNLSENIHVLKFLQIIQSLGIFVVPAILLGFLFKRSPGKFLNLDKMVSLKSLGMVALMMILALPIINFFAELNGNILDSLFSTDNWMKDAENKALVLTEAMLNVKTIPGLLLNLLMIAVIPAIGEEFLFRGVLQKLFIDWSKNIHISIWIVAILFSAIHMQFYGFIPRMLMGAFFGYIFVWSGSMWVPMLAHFINNAMAVIISYYIGMDKISEDIETIGSQGSTIILTALCFNV